MNDRPRVAGTLVIAMMASAAAVGAIVAAIGRPAPTRPVAIAPHLVDVNAASAAELELLPSVGPELAAKIIADRTARGPFANVADLDRVSGIGPATLADIAPHVRCGAIAETSGGAAAR